MPLFCVTTDQTCTASTATMCTWPETGTSTATTTTNTFGTAATVTIFTSATNDTRFYISTASGWTLLRGGSSLDDIEGIEELESLTRPPWFEAEGWPRWAEHVRDAALEAEREAALEAEYHGLAMADVAERREVRAQRRREQIEREQLARNERLAQAQRQQEELRRQQEEQKRQQDEALAVARQLLLANLTPEQRETFEKHKWFVVEGGKTKTRYRIRDTGSVVANVDVMEKEHVSHRLCAHCQTNSVPLPDQLLAQKLMLELSEDDFLRIANRHPAAHGLR